VKPSSWNGRYWSAYGLAQLASEELEEFGTKGEPRLSNEEITAVLRALRTVLRRLDIDLVLPFRDFAKFITKRRAGRLLIVSLLLPSRARQESG
jgi:hypothetical protein